MASPVQKLESAQVGQQFMWAGGRGLPLERPGLSVGPRSTLFEAQIDELIAKGLIGQRQLMLFCRNLRSAVRISSLADPGIKKRQTIVEKITTRGKRVEQLNDVSRASVTFQHLEELYAADAWVRESTEFRKATALGGAVKNRWTSLTSDGEYRDIKFFLVFPVERSGIPWVVELQLNLTIAAKVKGIGHGIYEITRLGDNLPESASIIVPADKVMRITGKLRKCYVNLKKTGIDPGLLEEFRLFIYRHFGKAMKNLEKPNYKPKGVTITPLERQMLNKVSQAVYTYSFRIANNAVAYKNGGMQELIKPNELLPMDEEDKWAA